jgi:TIR domain
MTTADLLLQYEVAPDQFRWTEYNGVPAGRKGWICLAAAGSAALKYVAELKLAIQADLLRSGAIESEESGRSVDPWNFDPSLEPDRRKVLFLIPSEDAPLHDVDWYAHWNSDEFLSHVMVAAKAEKYMEMFDHDLRAEDKSTHPLRAVNATFWQKRLEETVPEIFKRAEVTSPSSRVFISYRHSDTLDLALQLFEELGHKGFDVFLDRYSIPSGYNFQRRLNQELMDKSMVVLLESKNIQNSEWTRHEISFTVRYGLGLLTVPMPDVAPDTYLGSAARKPLSGDDFAAGKADITGMWGRLKDKAGEALETLVGEIKRVHAESLFQRRVRLRREIVSTLGANGVPLSYSAVGPFRVTQRSIDHIIVTTTRPPEVDDFHDLHSCCTHKSASCAQGAVVGPLATFEPDREKQLKWLETVTGCKAFDEGKLGDLAHWLLTGERV